MTHDQEHERWLHINRRLEQLLYLCAHAPPPTPVDSAGLSFALREEDYILFHLKLDTIVGRLMMTHAEWVEVNYRLEQYRQIAAEFPFFDPRLHLFAEAIGREDLKMFQRVLAHQVERLTCNVLDSGSDVDVLLTFDSDRRAPLWVVPPGKRKADN